MPQIEVSLFLVLILPVIYGQSAGNVKTMLNPNSDYHYFKPVLSACTSCEISDDKFYTRKTAGGHVPELRFSMTTNEGNFDIHLKLNDVFIRPGFSVSYLGYDWEPPKTYKEESEEEINNCYYSGYVVGIEDSLVVATTCHGLRGTIYLPDDLLHFEPSDEETFRHVLYRQVEDRTESLCGNPHHNHETFSHPVAEFKARNGSIRKKRSGDEEQMYVELLFVANKEMYEHFDTLLDLHEYVKELTNYLDTFYKILDIRVVLLHLEVWTREDKIPTTTVAGDNLESFMSYRTQKIQDPSTPDSPWKYTDNAQLLFGGTFDANKLGMASIGTMCSLRSAGVDSIRDTAQNTAGTITHEMGHNFGMNHDDGSCSCPENNCIMAASASRIPPETWSDCSRNYLEAGFKNGLDSCLLNELDSSKIFGGPKCGNNIVEGEEECDCGLLEDCISPCCNATTCKLQPGALCDTGSCCTEDCQFKDNCNVCRQEKNECDITEYCTGQSAHCPSNIYKVDGRECDNGAGVCHSGVCRTTDSQCKDVWGEDATGAVPACYEWLNAKGELKGNCGTDESGEFIPCAEGDRMCGKLGCAGGGIRPVISIQQAFITTLKTGDCKSVLPRTTTGDTPAGDISYVYEGTKCGEGKICYNFACVEASSVLTVCNKDCGIHGVCNNLGNCHCDAGYAPPDCINEGHGGSADSGPICANATYERPTRVTPAEEVNTEPDEEVENTEPNDMPTTKPGEVSTNQSPAEQTSPLDNNDDDVSDNNDDDVSDNDGDDANDNTIDEPDVEVVVDVGLDNSTNSYNTTSSDGTINKTSFKALTLVLLAIFHSL